MADYFAVLQRTLAGFDNPQPQLRTKLYERARLTIRRQLEGRQPSLSGEQISSEMEKLEKAISDIEDGFNGVTPAAAEPTPPEPEPAPPVEAPATEEQQAPPPPSDEPLFTPPAPPPEPEPVAEAELAPPAPPEEPPTDVTEPAEVAAEIASQEPAAPAAESSEEFLPYEPPATEPETPVQAEAPVPAEPEPETSAPASVDPDDPIAAALADFTKADEKRRAERAAAEPAQSEAAAPDADLLAAEAIGAAMQSLDVPPPQTETTESVEPAIDPAAEFQPSAASSPPPPPPSELAPVDMSASDESFSIPPPPPIGEDKPRQGRKAILWLLLLAILGAGGYAAYTMRDDIVALLPTSAEPVTAEPNKVKTITVRPEPESGESAGETSAPAPTAPEDDAPKNEARLGENGEETVPQATPPAAAETVETAQETPSEEQPASEATPAGARAFLYEEDAANGASSVDNGTITWSVVQEVPAPGQPEEPAIRAQLEIPERKTVLIMTIKRNADPGLTASHLVEMIFAVPDDFSGGAIEEINRVVLKENEEGRGETLTAGSVKISDGIFLVALDNLDASRERNVALLRNRDWIDIPVQYRTGRRALFTLEKGEEGKRVFDEVFSAWGASN